MTVPPLLHDRDRWERRVDAWIDSASGDAFTHTVRLVEPDAGVETVVIARPSPTYEIRSARATAVAGEVDHGALAGCAKLAGVPMIAGLGRRLAEATGDGTGAHLVRLAIIEVARLARQVAKIPPERAERALAAGPFACRELDREAFADLSDSCFTYSDDAAPLFGVRDVLTPMTAEIYSAPPGRERIFERRKVVRLERAGGLLRLFHSMHDNVHGFELMYEVDLASARIVRVNAVTSRLPYLGICSEPQRHVHALVGETLDQDLSKRIQGVLGGRTGCAQLYDLTSDLLKLV
jgi:hypothetical protein